MIPEEDEVMLARRIGSAALVSLLAITASAQESTPEARSREVAAAVEEQLARDRIAELGGISVSVNEGHVSLRGSVPSLMANVRAARVARTVMGVI